jgi:hypothetical protein
MFHLAAVLGFAFAPGSNGILLGLFIFAALCVWTRRTIPKGYEYTFESRGAGSFEPTLTRYARLVEVIIGLSTGSIALLAGSSFFHDKSKLPEAYGNPLALLAMSILALVLFIGLLTFFYEEWQHHPDQYTHTRCRLIVRLGFTGLLCFASGYGWLAYALVRG